ncbi:MAG TPA: hypothetical protein PKA05_14795 [Roseiflexaceae bacterium]|nr:hypothetical protein [Roseiflexaceae bacterium]HMP41645.1 hypothetical protein [Roseiflexaceae bacterium]
MTRNESSSKQQAQPAKHGQVDLEALTAAVERLLRRDLQIAHERLKPRGTRRR